LIVCIHTTMWKISQLYAIPWIFLDNNFPTQRNNILDILGSKRPSLIITECCPISGVSDHEAISVFQVNLAPMNCGIYFWRRVDLFSNQSAWNVWIVCHPESCLLMKIGTLGLHTTFIDYLNKINAAKLTQSPNRWREDQKKTLRECWIHCSL